MLCPSPLIMDQAVGTHSYRREYMYTVQWVESVYTACKVIKIGHNVHLTSCSKLGWGNPGLVPNLNSDMKT